MKAVVVVCLLCLVSEAQAVDTTVFLSWAASYQAARKNLPPSPDAKVQELRRVFAERFVGFVSGVSGAMASPYARRSGDRLLVMASCTPKTLSETDLADQVVGALATNISDARKVDNPSELVAAILAALYPYPCPPK